MLLQSAVFAWVPLLLGLAGLDVGVDLHKIIRVSVGRDNFHTWGGSDAPEENIAYAAANLFADSAREFAACLEGDDDIDLVQYAAATRQYLEILKLFGKFTAVSIGEVESNLKKVERAAGGRFRTMKALLRDEVEREIHGANAKLKDESAAMGLLWVRRGLGFWAELFELPDAELGARSRRRCSRRTSRPSRRSTAGSRAAASSTAPARRPTGSRCRRRSRRRPPRSTTTSACGCACCGCSTTGCARSTRSSASRTSARPYEP